VLQTLALIQRNCAEPKTVATLARQQERELRTWLYGSPAPPSPDDSLAAALERVSNEVEDLHGIKVETVAVGDCPLDARMQALVQSSREALTNAARHSGADAVSAFPELVPSDRRGIAESIVGRMNRYGGKAAIRSQSDEGTEVELVMPR
jgi:signal transduction histidine kinase